jgi:hypothetical protein
LPYSKFSQALSNYCLPRIAEYRDRDEDSAADSLADRYSAINTCYSEFGSRCQSLPEFCDRLANLFSDTKSPVVLSTIHRAKGDEADNVFLLGCNDLPYTAKAQKDWQIEQEYNLLYVALTRAKQSLYLVPLSKDPSQIDQLIRSTYGGLEIEPVPFKPTLPPVTVDPYLGRWFVYAGTSDSLKKQWRDVQMKVLHHNGAIAQCQGSNDRYYACVPIHNLEEVA